MLDVLDVSRDEACIDGCGEVIFIVQPSPEVRTCGPPKSGSHMKTLSRLIEHDDRY